MLSDQRTFTYGPLTPLIKGIVFPWVEQILELILRCQSPGNPLRTSDRPPREEDPASCMMVLCVNAVTVALSCALFCLSACAETQGKSATFDLIWLSEYKIPAKDKRFTIQGFRDHHGSLIFIMIYLSACLMFWYNLNYDNHTNRNISLSICRPLPYIPLIMQ